MKGKCILIIDDHLETCKALTAMIARRNGVAECACTLKEGIILERVKRENGNPYDCIVCASPHMRIGACRCRCLSRCWH
jgi:hypothetical protein